MRLPLTTTHSQFLNTLLSGRLNGGCATTILNSAIVDGIVRTQERYCFAEACTCVFNGDPYDDGSTWHVVVCEIADDGKISFVFNPDQHDQRQHSLEQFPAVGKMFFVKANS
jgi:hypothetical protein